jgi:hypothetical protein
MNIAHHIERGADIFPTKTALVFETQSFTYRGLDVLSHRVSEGCGAVAKQCDFSQWKAWK